MNADRNEGTQCLYKGTKRNNTTKTRKTLELQTQMRGATWNSEAKQTRRIKNGLDSWLLLNVTAS
jgi:hypothetical protein